MTRDDLRIAETGKLRGGNELATTQVQRLAAYDARHVEPVDGADRDEHQQQMTAEQDHQHDHEKHERQRIQHIDNTHHQTVDAAAEIACDCTVRSEEHTSELQSLMRNSYTVFC